jgi:cell division protein FtsL
MPTPGRTAWMQEWERDLVPSAAARRSAARVEARVSGARYYGREATARLPQPLPEAPVYEALVEVKVASAKRPRWGMICLAVIWAALLLAVAVVLPVLVNSAATGLEASIGKAEAQQRALAGELDTLAAQIAALSAPERVAKEADKLGLRPAASVHYLEVQVGAAAGEGDTAVAGR